MASLNYKKSDGTVEKIPHVVAISNEKIRGQVDAYMEENLETEIATGLNTFLETDTTLVKESEFGSKVNNYLSTNGVINIKMLGAAGDGVTDDTEIFKKATLDYDKIYLPYGTYVVDYDTMRTYTIYEKCYGEGQFIYINTGWDWDGKGTGLLKDPVAISQRYNNKVCKFGGFYETEIFKSMNRLTEAGLTYNHVNNSMADKRVPYFGTYTFTGDNINVNCQGSIQLLNGHEFPDECTLCVGRTQIYGYKNDKWHLLVNGIGGGKLYDSDWVSGAEGSVEPTNIIIDNHREYTITKDQWFNEEGMIRLLHIWSAQYILKENEVNTDYSYFITSMECWIKEEEFSDYFSFGVGSDLRDAEGNVQEHGLGRHLFLKSYPRTAYWHNIPNNVIDKINIPIKENTVTKNSDYLDNTLTIVNKYVNPDNILNLADNESTKYGVTATTTNQLVTLNGTWSATWAEGILLSDFILEKGDYTLSLWNVNNVTDNSFLILELNQLNSSTGNYYYLAGIEFSADKNYMRFSLSERKRLKLDIKIRQGMSEEGATFNIMINKGNDIPTEYSEYFDRYTTEELGINASILDTVEMENKINSIKSIDEKELNDILSSILS